MKIKFLIFFQIFIVTFLFNNINTQDFNFTFICENNSSCSNVGKCNNETHCQCDPYYTTVYNEKYDNLQCNYNQLSKSNAFMLSFFLGPISADQFFLGHLILGIIKLFLPLNFLLFGSLLFLLGKKNTSNNMIILGKSIEFTGSIIIIIWWLLDWILILCDYYNDENGVSLNKDL